MMAGNLLLFIGTKYEDLKHMEKINNPLTRGVQENTA